MSYKLLVEKSDPSEFEYILEEKNSKEPPRLYIVGPYMMAEGVNRNNRLYPLDELVRETKRYNEERSKQIC